MKKLFILLAGLFIISIATAKADNEQSIPFEQLPEKSQQFIKQYFSDKKEVFAKVEREFMDTSYEVFFLDGVKVEFLENGEWENVDCRYSPVPAGIVPEQIVAKVNNLYPNVQIVEIDRNRRHYEVSLTNGLELSFDLGFNLFDIDD